ncbi:Rpn family recombination-promoting nuclease/putative transposase [Haliangium sp.]|uniref:Rpn family recombination-promoting nuclease/putative transposase n=1 Tax=Haliangium sp. TaxID=2663208 RepID=UPI003D0AA81F
MSHEPSDSRDRDADASAMEPDEALPAPPHTVHDAFFKQMFSDPDSAAGELRAVLPERVAAHIDLDSLELQYASSVGDWLRQRHGDLIYSARTRDERPIFLWFLLEHQSTVNPLMAWEVLQKVVSIMQDWVTKNPSATRLPALLTFVLYNGDGPWTAPTSMRELLDLSDEARRDLGAHLLSYGYALDDLHQTPEAHIDARVLAPITRLVLLAMKPGGPDRMLARLRSHHADIRVVLHAPGGKDALETVLYYLWSTNDELTPERLTEELEPVVGQEIADPMQTVAQRIEQRGFDKGLDKGRDEGRKEGRKEGRREGRKEGQRLLLLEQLEERFGDLPEAVRRWVHDADQAELRRWSRRILTAASLDEVFVAL